MSTAIFQRSSEPSFQPPFFPTCNLWLDGSDASTQTLSGTNVTIWRDKSGLGNDGISTGGTTTVSNINSVRALSFNGTSSFEGTNIRNTGTTITAFMVATLGGGAASNARLLSVGLSTETDTASAKSSTLLNRLTTASSVYSTRAGVNTTIFAIGGTFLVVTQYNGSVNAVYLYGVQQGNSVGNTGNFGYERYRVGNTAGSGANAFWGGLVGEIIIYNASLTTSQRQVVEGYLAWKWGLTANLRDNHPYKNTQPSVVPSQPSVTLTFPLTTKNLDFFSPTSISGLLCWLDTSSLRFITRSSTSVTGLLDRSGRANNWSGTATLNITGTLGNNLPTISSPNGTTSQNNGITGSQPVTYVIIGSAVTNQLFIRNETNFSGSFTLTLATGNTSINNGANQVGSFLTVNVPNVTRMTFSEWNSPNSRIYDNGTLYGTSGNTSLNQGNGNTRIQASTGYQFGEFMIFNKVLSTTERQALEGYFAWKWGLTANLPATHPYKNTILGTPNPILSVPMPISRTVWIPTNVPGSVCRCWLDAADVSTFTLSGTSVTQWRDKSGTNNHYTNVGSIQYSNKGVSFPGTAYMQNTSQTGFLFGTSPSMSTFIVFSYVNAASTRGLFSYGNVSCNKTGYVVYVDNDVTLGNLVLGTLYCGDLNVNGRVTANTLTMVSDVVTFRGVSGSLSRAGFVNGSAMDNRPTDSTTGVNLTNSGTSRLGDAAGGYFLGSIYEVVFFSTAVSTFQRQQVEGYLAWKWGMQGSLPLTHPYKLFPPPP